MINNLKKGYNTKNFNQIIKKIFNNYTYKKIH